MKRYVAIFGVIAAGLLLAGCATVDKDELAKLKNVAVISVYCDKKVDTSSFGLLASALNETFQSDKFNMQPTVDKLRDRVFGDFQKVLGFSLADEATVQAAPEYQKLVESRASGAGYFALPKGYALVSVVQKDDFTAATRYVPDSTGALVLQATFQLSKVVEDGFGGGLAKVDASLMIVVKNGDGKDVVSTFGLGTSDQTIPFVLGGIFDASQLQGMCETAVAHAADSLLSALKDQLK